MKAGEEALSDFINALGRSRDSEELLNLLPSLLSKFCRADEIAIALLLRGREEFSARSLAGPGSWSGTMPLRASAVAEACERMEPLVESEIGKYSNFFDVRKLAENGMKSYAIFPLSCEGKIYATLNLASSSDNSFKARTLTHLSLAVDYFSKLLYALRSSERARKRSTSAAISSVMPHIYLSLDEDYRLSLVDGDPELLLGYSSSDLEGMRLSSIVHSDDYTRLNSVLQQLSEGSPVKYIDFTLISKDGAHKRFELRGLRRGALTDCLLLPSDSPAIGSEARRHSRLSDLSSDAIYTMDLFGVVRSWNRAAQKLLGYRAEEIVGTEARRLFEDERTDELDELMRVLKGGKHLHRSRTARIRKDGKKIPVRSSAFALSDDDGKITGYTELLKDLSALVRLEAAEKELRKQVLKNRKLSRENDEKSKFISDVSHELRTPLTNIHGYAELLKEGEAGELSEEQREFIGIICDETDRLSRLITDVLDLSRMESKKLKLDMQAFDPRVLEEQCSCDSMAREKGLYVKWNFEPDVKEIYGDQAKIAQVLINLISNAIKFTKQGGITVNVKNLSRTFIQFDVIDTGAGIPAEELPKLFKRFSQLSAGAKRKG
ncbi:hypothetical protein DRN67_00405, partial [Candidatus Micrarchaeota archaeon]